MPTALYGSNLDMLGQADIADRDQTLRGRTANQGFLAQLAGERTRRRATEANYDVGLRNQETQRLASQRALDAALAGDVARMNIADITSGRGLEGIIAGTNANKYIADTQGNASRYTADTTAETLRRQNAEHALAARRNAEFLKEAEENRLAYDREIASAPKVPSEAMQTMLLGGSMDEKRRAATASRMAQDANIAAAPGLWETVVGTPLNWLSGSRRARKQRERSISQLQAMREAGLDTSQVYLNPDGTVAFDPEDPTFKTALGASNAKMFGVPTAVGTTPSTAGAGAAAPVAPGGKKRISLKELRDAANGPTPEAPPGASDAEFISGLRGLPW